MIERDKQVTDQQKKHAAEKERREHPQQGPTHQPEPPAIGSDTDPKTMENKEYVETITEKTEKH